MTQFKIHSYLRGLLLIALISLPIITLSQTSSEKIHTGWINDSLYLDLIYEKSVDAYLLRTNHEGIKQIRRFRQALLEEQEKNKNLAEIVMYMGEDFTKCRDLVDGLEAQSLNLRRTLSISQSATDNAEEEIMLHIEQVEKEKRNKKIWRWVAIGEAVILGGVMYGLLK
jgi:hypothetical protein